MYSYVGEKYGVYLRKANRHHTKNNLLWMKKRKENAYMGFIVVVVAEFFFFICDCIIEAISYNDISQNQIIFMLKPS